MKKYIFIILILLSCFYVSGQDILSSVVSTAGNSVEEGGIEISWTLGDLVIETQESGSIILTQGFQQSYYSISSLIEPVSDNFKLKVYPNPASEFIWISIESDEPTDVIIELYDLNGKLIKNNILKRAEGQIKIPVNDLSASQYILKVSDSSGNFVQTFKLIKR